MPIYFNSALCDSEALMLETVLIVYMFVILLFPQTDDKGVFATSLSEEYHIATLTFSLNQDDVRKLSLEAVDAVFEEDYFKLELKKMWDSI